jgi:hypothetical protein
MMNIRLSYAQDLQLIELLKAKRIEIERLSLTDDWSNDGLIPTFPIVPEWKLYQGDRGGCVRGCDQHGPQMVGEINGSRYTIYFEGGMQDDDPALGWLWNHTPSRDGCWDCK